ncbi:Asp-tRNA(Asn)/Glu-tRNA(Gln) amidotransferase subunit GatC [Desulfurella sp.]|uniref:Asp-tRNA(Asn)/Glu-tRNA(Gln) amidotransferase subunit GatC n=1 Tax=Desulfurella sp. TaxID=1962857 RepID=UPI0025BC6A93|nr:Asp-tRNA(Asn)/Glu-tRNA(Gln) amidotransferase subunit GatC [Desulfurella sp.]
MISKQELKKLESLAKLKFDDSELEKFNNQLNDILNYMKELDELDLSNIEPLSNILSSVNFFREDKVDKTFGIQDILKNAPQVFERQFVVPKVI